MHKQSLYRFLYTATFVLLKVVVCAQVKLTVLPSKTIVELNETFQLQYVVEGTNEVDEFTAPAFRNFEQLGSFEKTTGVTWINGALTEYITFTVNLRAKIAGRLPIASALVKAKGKMATSSTLMIFVKPATDQTIEEERPDYYLLPNENVKDKIAKNIFVKATLNKSSCYVGEAILATFKLFTRLDSESKIIKRPSLNGFSVVDMEQPETGNFSKEMFNGKMYNCYLIRKVQLFPLQSGELTIEPVEVENLVRLIKAKAKTKSSKETSTWLDAVMDKMKEAEIESAGTIEERFVLKSDELKINVLDVPEKSKPESFNGAVGTFTMETSLLTHTIAANDNATLRIVIKGHGNLPMITSPVVNWPSGVDSFDAKLTENIDKKNTPISGSKTFDIPFSVSKTGTFVIPVIQFSYFNQSTKTYHTLMGDTLQLQVTAAVKRKTPVFDDEIMEEETPRWVWVASVGGTILLLMITGLVIQSKRNKKKHTHAEIVKEAAAVIEKTSMESFLQPAAVIVNNTHKKQFYTLLMQGMEDYIVDRFQLQAQTVNTTIVTTLLKQQQLTEEADRYQQITYTCELAVFSPVELTDDREELFDAANKLLQQIEAKHFA